jgi:hypothetical protein
MQQQGMSLFMTHDALVLRYASWYCMAFVEIPGIIDMTLSVMHRTGMHGVDCLWWLVPDIMHQPRDAPERLPWWWNDSVAYDVAESEPSRRLLTIRYPCYVVHFTRNTALHVSCLSFSCSQAVFINTEYLHSKIQGLDVCTSVEGSQFRPTLLHSSIPRFRRIKRSLRKPVAEDFVSLASGLHGQPFLSRGLKA